MDRLYAAVTQEWGYTPLSFKKGIMMNKKHFLLPGFLTITMLAGCGSTDAAAPVSTQTAASPATERTASASEAVPEDVTLEKSAYGNPIIRLTDEKGDRIYGGDPAVYVDGDTAYL